MFDKNEDADEFFLDTFEGVNPLTVIAPDGTTIAEVNEAIKGLADDTGTPGPFTWMQVSGRLIDIRLKNLVKAGEVESYIGRDGVRYFKLPEKTISKMDLEERRRKRKTK